MQVLGIDFGGSAVKGAMVDTRKGTMTTERFRIPLDGDSSPKIVGEMVAQIAEHFSWKGLIGCGFPAVVMHGEVKTAANIDKSWIGVNAEDVLSRATGCPVAVVNDADCAGMAERQFGAGRNQRGVVVLLTIGTGIGSAVFIDGTLVPNTEFGHLRFKGGIAERYASAGVRDKRKLSLKAWAKRFDEYLRHLEWLLWPDLIILGGGISKKFEKFSKYLTTRTPVVQATLMNQAGIVGAALYAESRQKGKGTVPFSARTKKGQSLS